MASSFPERRSPSQRFLPPDPRVTEPYRFTPQLAIRVGVLGAIALAVFAVLFLRLWALQVLSGDRYLHAAQQNQVRTVRVEAARGTILDRSGKTLVSNVPGTAVKIWTADLPDEGRYAMFKRLSKILHVPLPRLTKALEERKDDPLTPILVQDGRARVPGRVPLGAPRRVPGRRGRRHVPPRLRVPRARRPAPRLRRRDLAAGARAAQAGGLPRRRQDRQDRGRGGLRRAPARASPARPRSASTRSGGRRGRSSRARRRSPATASA